MREHSTQRLFWKKWPFKAIIEVSIRRGAYDWRLTKQQSTDRRAEFALLKEQIAARFPKSGTRCETNLSVFLHTEDELAELLDFYGHKIIDIWKPKSKSAMDTLLAHTFDVVRAKSWYGQYPIRARIPFTSEFRVSGLKNLQVALESLGKDTWHCNGMLKDMLLLTVNPRLYGYGQPLHLYLSSTDDAAMLRLLCGDVIERFEQIRAPEQSTYPK